METVVSMVFAIIFVIFTVFFGFFSALLNFEKEKMQKTLKNGRKCA